VNPWLDTFFRSLLENNIASVIASRWMLTASLKGPAVSGLAPDPGYTGWQTMPDFCTCGAELVPDALFCHKCGRPLRDVAPVEASETAAAPAPPPAFTPSVAPSFRNPAAVRVGITMASLASLLSAIPIVGVLNPVWFFGAGFLAPFAYRKRTGQPLSMRNGARMGWITGVFGFLITTIIITLNELISSGAGLSAALREQVRNMPAGDPNMQRAVDMLQTPLGVGLLMVFAFLFFFALTLALCTAGGALGARIAQKD
jgi:hypothetical protein